MANNFLDKTGLSYFWEKIKTWVNEKLANKLDKPSGGTAGQILEKTADGSKWADKPVMYVTVTNNGGTFSSDKFFSDIYDAYQNGANIIAIYGNTFYPLRQIISEVAEFSITRIGSSLAECIYITINSGGDIEVHSGKANGTNVAFSPTSEIESDTVQGAIEEVDAKVTNTIPKQIPVTLTAAGWSSNSQIVTVAGVLADETKQLIQPTPALASQAAYNEAGILCTGQAENALTFTAEEAPSSDLTVYIVIQELKTA